jgi:hypothetical protein
MKPEWKDAPAWARWLAMDDTGSWVWFEKKPIIKDGRKFWETEEKYMCKFADFPNWKQSLEERPKQCHH